MRPNILLPVVAVALGAGPRRATAGRLLLLDRLLRQLRALGRVGVGEAIGGAVAALPQGSRPARGGRRHPRHGRPHHAPGNPLAAFPVMTAAIALPLPVGVPGGNAVVVTAIGRLSGGCGTLLTPTAANGNIVPARRLGLDDRLGVIRAPVATALPLLAVSTLLIAGVACP